MICHGTTPLKKITVVTKTSLLVGRSSLHGPIFKDSTPFSTLWALRFLQGQKVPWNLVGCCPIVTCKGVPITVQASGYTTAPTCCTSRNTHNTHFAHLVISLELIVHILPFPDLVLWALHLWKFLLLSGVSYFSFFHLVVLALYMIWESQLWT